MSKVHVIRVTAQIRTITIQNQTFVALDSDKCSRMTAIKFYRQTMRRVKCDRMTLAEQSTLLKGETCLTAVDRAN